jgi:hypothetical protein
MLAASGALKVRGTSRTGLGVSPFALLELGAAVGLMFLALPGADRAGMLVRWSVPCAVALLVVSSVDHGRRLGAQRRHQADTEGGRLVRYVRYTSDDRGAL